MEQPVLLPKGSGILIRMRLGRLELHIGIRNLRDIRQVKDTSQKEHKDGDRSIHPLDILQRPLIVEGEEDIGSQHGRDHGADAVEGLREVDAGFGELGGSAHGDVGVGCCLEGAETVADDEDAGAEAAEGVGEDGGDGQQGAQAVEEEAPDEDGSVAVVAEDPGCVAEGGERVCSVVGSLVTVVFAVMTLAKGCEDIPEVCDL